MGAGCRNTYCKSVLSLRTPCPHSWGRGRGWGLDVTSSFDWGGLGGFVGAGPGVGARRDGRFTWKSCVSDANPGSLFMLVEKGLRRTVGPARPEPTGDPELPPPLTPKEGIPSSRSQGIRRRVGPTWTCKRNGERRNPRCRGSVRNPDVERATGSQGSLPIDGSHGRGFPAASDRGGSATADRTVVQDAESDGVYRGGSVSLLGRRGSDAEGGPLRSLCLPVRAHAHRRHRRRVARAFKPICGGQERRFVPRARHQLQADGQPRALHPDRRSQRREPREIT